MFNSEGPNMWKVTQGLNGTPDANSPNEAMSHDGWTITDIKSKANVFINHYARVSKLNMSQSDSDINRQFKKHLNTPSVDDEICAPLLMGELLSVIKKMKDKGATGPDNTPPSFIKSLGPLALQELLSMFNSSFSLAHCPWIWRVATIIPPLKAGKSPSEVALFHAISLTSCVVKLLERILADRLYYTAKTSNLFSQSQAGFCKGRSCEDQITWMVQEIQDGFQKCLMERSETIQSLFNDRRARVQFFNIFSLSWGFTQGLPQGSILAPLLFLFCINSLASLLNDDAVIALFADDVSNLTITCKKEDAEAAAQSIVNSVVIWSQEWKLNLSTDKYSESSRKHYSSSPRCNAG